MTNSISEQVDDILKHHKKDRPLPLSKSNPMYKEIVAELETRNFAVMYIGKYGVTLEYKEDLLDFGL